LMEESKEIEDWDLSSDDKCDLNDPECEACQ
jgi:hypothetical protein